MKNKLTIAIFCIASLIIGLMLGRMDFKKSKKTVVSDVKSYEIGKIDSVLDAQVQGWNDGKLNVYMKGYWKDDSLRFITRNGINKGWNNVFSSYKKHFGTKEKMGQLDFEIYEKRFLDTTYQLVNYVGMYRVNKLQDGKPLRDSGVFSLLFRKFDNEGWKIITDHTF